MGAAFARVLSLPQTARPVLAAAQLRDAQRADRWFRNVSKMTCSFCPFANLCLNCTPVNTDAPPVGYEILLDVHPELQLESE
jgi:hypothetical protein